MTYEREDRNVSDDEPDEAIMDDLHEDAEDLEVAAEGRAKGEQGDSALDRARDALEDVVPGLGRSNND
jgi:hypothetical protein